MHAKVFKHKVINVFESEGGGIYRGSTGAPACTPTGPKDGEHYWIEARRRRNSPGGKLPSTSVTWVWSFSLSEESSEARLR